jgi:hypothetical protein
MTEHFADHTAVKTHIEACIRDNKPFSIMRFSGIETLCTAQVLIKKINQRNLHILGNNAGIYIANMDDLVQYAIQTCEAYKSATMHAVWKNDDVAKFYGDAQKYIRKQCRANIPEIYAPALEPHYFLEKGYEHTWPAALRGKRILIVSPFVESIRSQVDSGNLRKIFKCEQYFEDCTFCYVKAPLTLAGNHQGHAWTYWFDKLKTDIDAVGSFDVALLSCGGYAAPLAGHIFNKIGRSVIYIGGALQMMFGVMGGRWKSFPFFQKLLSDSEVAAAWISPTTEERPANLKAVEGGCYW